MSDSSQHILELLRRLLAEGPGNPPAPDEPAAEAPEDADASRAPGPAAAQLLWEALEGFDPYWLETREERLTFWINVHNAVAVYGSWPCRIGGASFSHEDIKYGILRNNSRRLYRPWRYLRLWDRRRRLAPQPPEPRAVFALYRQGLSGGPCFFETEALNGQLHEAVVEFLANGGVAIDRDSQSIRLSPLLRECAADFGGGQGVMRFIAAHLEPSEDTAFLYAKAGRVDIIFEK